MDWEFEISFVGEDDMGKYEFKLNGCRVDKLEKAEGMQRDVPPLSKSTVLPVESDTLKSVVWII